MKREQAEAIVAAMVSMREAADDDAALGAMALYPAWRAGEDYPAGERVLHAGRLWRCSQAHSSQDGWEPGQAPSLWAEVLPGQSGEVGEWVQPGSDNPYMRGDRVTHGGKTWVSLVDGNVWEPGAAGTGGLWREVA